MDTYRINNKFGKATPTNSFVSHTFIATTAKDPVTGKETVTSAYSWVDTNGGEWEDETKSQNITGAQKAIDSGIGAWKVGDSSFDSYVKEAFEEKKNEEGGFWPWTSSKENPYEGNCKQQANDLIDKANTIKEQDIINKGATNDDKKQ
jgi:hypothetical protein